MFYCNNNTSRDALLKILISDERRFFFSRKYRILDDCSRLRNIFKALPVKRRFIPSLLIISWTDGEENNALSDFFDMVGGYFLIYMDRTCINYFFFSLFLIR